MNKIITLVLVLSFTLFAYAGHADAQPDDVKIKSVFLFNEIDLSDTEAKNGGRDTRDFKVIESMLWKSDYKTNYIRFSHPANGKLMGSMTFISTGDDVTADGLYCKAAERAMEAGATHFVVRMQSGVYSIASASTEYRPSLYVMLYYDPSYDNGGR